MKKLTMILSALTVAGALQAQSGNGPGDFMIERVLTLSGVVAPAAPNLPPPVLAGIQNGTLEIHQRLTYNSASRTLDQVSFLVPGQSALPFPDLSAVTVADRYSIQIDSANVNASPQSVVLSGRVTSNSAVTPFGDITGAGLTLTFGYTNSGDSVQFGPIVESVSPLYGIYTASGAGSLSLTAAAQGCTLATLNGAYIFTLGGSVQGSSGWAPYWESGRFSADGNGKVTMLDSGNLGGQSFVDRAWGFPYTLRDDCTGTFDLTTGSVAFQITPNGKSITMTFTKPSSVAANGSGKRS